MPRFKHFQSHIRPQHRFKKVSWIGREYNNEVDRISKTIDLDDWYMTQHLINILEQRWGKISFDRFAWDINRKCKRFNSRYLTYENLLVPPTSHIPRAIKHFLNHSQHLKQLLSVPTGLQSLSSVTSHFVITVTLCNTWRIL